MAEKKPLSLNERNERLIRELAQTRSAKDASRSTIYDDRQRAEPKFNKVKLEGRRRLCKFSSSNEDSYRSDEPIECDSQGRADSSTEKIKSDDSSDIRDILNDLSSRLDFLSTENTTVTGTLGISGNISRLPKHQAEKSDISCHHLEGTGDANRHHEVLDDAEYISATSSMSSICLISGTDSEDSADSSSVAQQDLGVKGVEPGVNQVSVNIQIESDTDDSLSRDSSLLQQFSTGTSHRKTVTLSPANLTVSKTSAPHGKRLPSGTRYSEKEDKYGINIEVLDDGPVIMDDKDCIMLRSQLSTYCLPGKIAKLLYPHQRDGLGWLWALHCRPGGGGILGDDMGLGKTMQVSSFLAGLFASCLITRAMIVAPKTLLAHWTKELSIVGLGEKIRDFFGASGSSRQYELQYILQDGGVLLTTYDIVRNNFKSLSGPCSFHEDRSEDSMIWDYVILDEGHIIKNPTTQRAKSLLEIPSAHRLIISGTPIQNNLKELWALFNFCCPEILGDKKEFKDRYEYAILRGNEKNASEREKRVGSTVAKVSFNQANTISLFFKRGLEDFAKELRERIKPFFLRRLKCETFPEDAMQSVKLPKKNEMVVWLRLSQCQRQLYESFLKSEMVHSSLDGSVLAALTDLHTGRTIGRGREKDGLYHLEASHYFVVSLMKVNTIAVATVTCLEGDILYQRLGHLGNSRCEDKLADLFTKVLRTERFYQFVVRVLKKICDHPLLLTKRAADSVLEGIENMPNGKEMVMAEEMALNLANIAHHDDAQNLRGHVSCKISFILCLLDNLVNEGHRVLIFSQSRKMLDIIQEEVVLKGYMFLRIDGTTKACEREKIVNDFQEHSMASIFLLTSQVGGLGLTLTRADRVIVVDPAWNPRGYIVDLLCLIETYDALSVDNQSVDRAYRIGQNKDVIVYRLMTSGTIEEKIYKMQVFKGGLFKTATEHKEQTRYFSQKDLRELFSLPEQGFDISLTQKQLHEEHDNLHAMDDSLKDHIKFLQSQGIAGVSHHNLLFSKTTPLPFVQEDRIVLR